jgi:UDP-N-acetylmuramoyl-tripeptide--D-alanyl-D-alanine ligase
MRKQFKDTFNQEIKMIRAQTLLNCKNIKSIQGEIHPENSFRFCSDSRSFRKGDLFFCIPGEKFNPVIFIDELLNKGLYQVVVEYSPTNVQSSQHWLKKNPQLIIVWTNSVVDFIQELASLHVLNWKTDKRKVIAISGSNGKTTTKEMLSFLLKGALGEHHVVSTEKNNNNQLGVPFTIFNIHQLTEVLVLEFGSNHPGEIKKLCEIAHPDWAVTTNIGATHLEFFKTEEAVFKEEALIYYELKNQPESRRKFFLNSDDMFLSQLKSEAWTTSFGENPSAHIRFKFSPQKISIDGQWQTELSNTHITGKHNFFNLGLAWLIASSLFPEHRGTFSFLAGEFKPTLNRSEWRQSGHLKIFLDAYNANPSSMRSAISGFHESVVQGGVDFKEVALVIGDMNELGDLAPDLHRELAKEIGKQYSFDIYFIGRYKTDFLNGCSRAKISENVENFKKDYWQQLQNSKTHLFIKASRSLQLESILDIT